MGRVVPKGLTEEEVSVWCEVQADLKESAPDSIVMAYVGQVMTSKQARDAVAKDGVIVRDGKGNAVEHPAFATERAAIRLMGELLREWKAGDGLLTEG